MPGFAAAYGELPHDRGRGRRTQALPAATPIPREGAQGIPGRSAPDEIPVLPVGGITPNSLKEYWDAGADGSDSARRCASRATPPKESRRAAAGFPGSRPGAAEEAVTAGRLKTVNGVNVAKGREYRESGGMA